MWKHTKIQVLNKLEFLFHRYPLKMFYSKKRDIVYTDCLNLRHCSYLSPRIFPLLLLARFTRSDITVIVAHSCSTIARRVLHYPWRGKGKNWVTRLLCYYVWHASCTSAQRTSRIRERVHIHTYMLRWCSRYLCRAVFAIYYVSTSDVYHPGFTGQW